MALAWSHRGGIVGLLLLHTAAAGGWQVTEPGAGEALTAAVAPGGDVIAGGFLAEDASGRAFTVLRLAAADGAERWRRVLLPGGTEGDVPAAAHVVALDAAGDVIVAGTTTSAVPQLPMPRFTVAKLLGATGVVAWRYDVPGHGFAVAVDGAGDVIATGTAGNALVVVKLARGTGTPLWERQLRTGFEDAGSPALAVHPSQDVIASFWESGASVVVRLDGTTGGERWRNTLPGAACVDRLAVSPAGDVFAAGSRCVPLNLPYPPQYGYEVAIRRLAGDSGAELWSHSSRGVDALLLDADGNPIVVTTQFMSMSFGIVPSGIRAVRLAGADGVVLADHVIYYDSYPPCDVLTCRGESRGGALMSSGDVIVSGNVDRYNPTSQRFTTVRLSGRDLAAVWRRDDDASRPAPGSFIGRAVVVGANERAAIAGSADGSFGVLSIDAVNGSLGVCGDAIADEGELCDDGAVGTGCCADDCHAAAVADGSPCDDADVCSQVDRCMAGRCQGAERIPCEPCGTCDPQQGCVGEYPPVECGQATATNAATLLIEAGREGRRASWVMRYGPAIQIEDFGDPTTTTGYALCAYVNADVAVRALSPGGRCGGRRCWKRTRYGFEYRNPRAPEGIARLSLRAGEAGHTRLRAVARGKHLLVPHLPLELFQPVSVYLRRLDGAACWSADHEDVEKNRSDVFRVKGQ